MTTLLLIRHGETEWSRDGRHTGRTDIPLTDRGRSEAEAAAITLAGWKFDAVYSSPLQRARETSTIVDLPHTVEVDERLQEWDYGEFEGITTATMRETVPDWSIWTHQPTAGETAEDVGRRIDGVIGDIVETHPEGTVAVFAHGHFLSIFVARWLELNPVEGRRFKLETATVTLLDFHREDRVLRVMNHRCGDLLPLPARR